MQQMRIHLGNGIVGARQAIKQRDLTQPIGRVHKGQDALLASLGDTRNAQTAVQDGIQTVGRIASQKEVLARAQPLGHCQRQQVGGKGLANRTEPRPGP